MMEKKVSVIIPVYNEEKYINRCLDSVVRQTYPKSLTEIIIVDGGSTDQTKSLIANYESLLNIHLIHNAKRMVTYALNLGIENATGDYIIRLDAHAEFKEDYIEKCVYYLNTTDAQNVGGIAETVGIGKFGEMNAEILSSKFGVGNSAFRTETKSGYVDTVPFGAFRKEVFDSVGLFNSALPRSEDNDMNSRIRAMGGKIFMAADIRFTYFCRDTIGGLLNQGMKNGNALFLTLRKNPKAMSVRHFIPFLFVLSLIVMPYLSALLEQFLFVFIAEMLLYGFLDVYFSLKGNKRNFVYKLWMYPLFHITYGLGSVLGMFNIKLY
ncbi:MAG: glycosyltransferase family 2 protein [Ruminococcaceae bacterium]|nr:glycosyltransferase family 2 protein [Oscillospiraceae bacterium]